jgi:hypothetical protein
MAGPTGAVSPPPERGRFRLTGPSRPFDPRIHAVRRDVADIAIAEWIFAPHYAQARPHSVTAASTMLRTAANDEAPAGSQLLFGEDFHVLDAARGWGWGFCGHDHYVGYVRMEALGLPTTPTHIISAREALMFAKPDIKAPVVLTLSLGARLEGAIDGDFLATPQGFVHRRHVRPLDATDPGDPAAIAGWLLGAPYLWGGRGAGGVDCSGLVQLALSLAGRECPRDSDQQREVLGHAIEDGAPLARGDLVFFPGHVGLMADESHLLHANAFWMTTLVEPIEDVIDRLRPAHEQPVLAIRRMAP